MKTSLYLLPLCALLLPIQRAGANPLGGTVVPGSGAASFSSSLGTLTINQSTPKVIINWQDFSIGAGELTRFVQPSASAAALNRVTTANPSQIYGTLQANGTLYLINPNGILVGRSGQINVGSFIGSTLDLGPDQDSANASFLAGAGLRLFGESTAAIRNEGYISALDDVFLVAHTVQNAGEINGHTVGLAAGAEVELRSAGSERISVLAGNSKAKPGSSDGVVNSGNIAAVSAELKAAGGNIYALAINNGGAVRATGIVKENGRIILRADRGTVVNSGTLDASSKTPGGKGGDVQVLGQRVGLVGNSKIDASGDAGGGTVLVGGDFQGKNANVPNAERTLVSKDSSIKADALSSGNGGKVIVWSDEATRYLGSISAKGAGHRTSGGFVEVSGKAGLTFDGTVNVAGGRGGANGTVLLDPATITIQAAGPDINGDSTTGDDIAALTDLDNAAGDFPGANSIITAGAVNSLLTGNNNLVLAADVSTTVNAAVTGSGDASLTLNAPRVDLNAPITLAGSGVLSGNPTLVNVGTGGRIQNGVDVAAPGATVNVAAGSYAENISVAKGLNLRGAKADIDARTRPLSGESIIQGQVRLLAPGITFNGFTVRDSAGGAGIVANNAAGDRIINNYITANVFGMSLASDGSSELLVEHNFFENDTLPGSASGNGIYTDFTVSNVRVNANRFTGHPEGSVTFLGTPASTISAIRITDNEMTMDGPISIGNISDVTIRGNSVSGNSGHALWVGGGATMVSITENALHNNMGAGLKFARPGSSGIAAVSSGFTVSGNSFQGNADGAVVIDTSEGSRYTGTLNASGNWWGSASGPNVASVGFLGGGDAIIDTAGPNDRVDFSPWLNSGTDLASGTPGFQGDFSVLNVSPLSPKAAPVGYIAEALGLLSGAGQRLQLFAGTYNDQAIIDVPAAVAVVLKGNVTLDASTSVSFGSTVDTDGTAHTLALTTPTATLGGAVGNAAPNTELGSLSASGSTAINGGIVKTTGNQTYTGPVTLGTDTALAGSTITFQDTVDGVGNGTESLTINGNAVFGNSAMDFVGNVMRLEFLDVSGTAALNGGTVRTAGAQDYDGTVTLGADTTLIGSTITFGSTVNGTTADTESLTIAGNGIFGGAVGNAVRLEFVDVSGMTALNGGTVQTAGAQDYDGAVTLGADTTLNGSTITFGSTVNGTTADSEGLTVVGNATFRGAVGNGVRLELVDVSGTTALNGGSVRTAGAQDYDGAVTLGADTTLTGSAITFGSTVNGTIADNESLSIVGNGTFRGAVGNAVRLELVDVSGTTALNGGTVRTAGAQDYDGAVTLGADTTLTGSAITFGSTVNGTTANTESLTIVGNGTFGGAVGNSVRLELVDVSGTTALNGGTVRTAGAQDYDGAVTLGADTTLNGSTITFGSTVNGAGNGTESLTINGNAVFGNSAMDFVGNVMRLEFLDVSGTAALNGGVVRTAGAQDYDGAVTLGTDTTLTGSTITFGNTVNGTTADTESLTIGGSVTFAGAVGNAVRLEFVDVSGATALNGGTVRTADVQDYNGAVTLGADTTLSGSTITFGSAVNGTTAGNESLAVVGNATFQGPVGTGVSLELLDVSGMTALNGGTVTTAGAQTYVGAVTLGADTTLNNTTVAFGSTVQGNGNDLTLNSSSDVTLNGPSIMNVGTLRAAAGARTTLNGGLLNANTLIDILDELVLGTHSVLNAPDVSLAAVTGAGNDLSVTASGSTTFGGIVSGVRDLNTDAPGSMAINGGAITTIGNQTYGDAVNLGADTTLSGANVRFASTVSGGDNDLTVNSAGTTAFGGTVAGVGDLTTDAPGTTAINGGSVSTIGSQTFNDDITLGANTTLNNTTVAFGATVQGNGNDLTLNSSGDVTLNGPSILNVGTLRAAAGGRTTLNGGSLNANTLIDILDELVLGTHSVLNAPAVSLAVVTGAGNDLSVTASGLTTLGGVVAGVRNLTTDLPGTTAINGGSVTTTGNQNYNDAVTLGANATLSGANVTLASTVDGGGNDLRVNSPGVTTFSAAVANVRDLVTDAPGSTAINGGAIMTVGNQTYNDAVTLGANTTLSGVDVRLASTVAGSGNDLTVNGSGVTTFGAAVSDVRDLTTDAAGSTAINGGAITTTRHQTYNDAVALGANTLLSGVDVTFGSTVAGAGRDLTVNGSGVTTFAAAVSGVRDLTTDGAGTTAINGGAITTARNQTYNDAVTLGTHTTLAGVNVRLGSTVAGGGNDLTVNGSGVTTFDQAVNAVRNLTTDAAGSTAINGGAINTVGNQTYNDDVGLGLDAALSGVNVAFGSTVSGAGNDLTVNGSGTTTFGGAVGGVRNLITDGPGTTAINGGSIATIFDQTYNDAVTLGAGTTLSGDNVTLASTLTGGGNNLSVNASGATTFGGVVDSIANLSTDAGGSTHIDGGAIFTSGNQTYGDSVFLGSSATLSSGGGSLNFNSTLSGAGNALTLSAGANVEFNGDVTLGQLNIVDANNAITRNAALILNNLLFTIAGAASFVDPDNAIQNALANCDLWSALGGYLVSDSLSAQFYRGTVAGTCLSADFNESLEKVISALVPQVQFEEIQAEAVELKSGKKIEKAGILTRSSDIFVKPTEVLTRSGQVQANGGN